MRFYKFSRAAVAHKLGRLRFQTAIAAIGMTLLAGCGVGSVPEAGTNGKITGLVRGGQAPVSGSLIQLYAAGTAGDGSAATPLIHAIVTSSDGSGDGTNANANAGNDYNAMPAGSFTITGDYGCPTTSTPVYLTSTGGNPGLTAGNDNSALALMVVLGTCGDLMSQQFLVIDELTTVGSIVPLTKYMSSYAAVGSGSSDVAAFNAAIAAVNEYTNTSTGTVPGPALPAGDDGSSVSIATLADVLAGCVNSGGGVAGDSSQCGQLFQLTTLPGQAAPTDTVGAALNLIKYPILNVSEIYDQLPSTPPYEPVLTSSPGTWQFPILPSGAALSTTSVVPSSNGIPISIARLGYFEFVPVQGTGQIFTYDFSSGALVQVGTPYQMPCSYPSGIEVTNIAGADVMAVVCYDTNSLVTLSVNPDGSLSALGSVSGLNNPYPGVALDGTNMLIPTFGVSYSSNGGVTKVSLASPANPVITGTATLVPSAVGTYANPGFLTVANGYIYLCAGSESDPRDTSSSIQVVRESDMSLVGAPLIVPHSPQQIAIAGNVLYTTLYDVQELESIDISNPASLQELEIVSTSGQNCFGLPILVHGTTAYVGCYESGEVLEFDVSNPSNMQMSGSIPGISYAQEFEAVGPYLLTVGSDSGGSAYMTVGVW